MVNARNEITIEKSASNERLHCACLQDLLDKTRDALKIVSDQTVCDLERILDENLIPTEVDNKLYGNPKQKNKMKPGRKKKKEEEDSNMNIDQIFKKASKITDM